MQGSVYNCCLFEVGMRCLYKYIYCRMMLYRIGTLSQTVNKEEVGHISDTKQVDDDNCSTSTAKCDSLASIQSQKEDRDTTRSFSIHPGNSVWIHL